MGEGKGELEVERELVGRLRKLYARAMELELDFFAEHWQPQGKGRAARPWRGIDPGAWGVCGWGVCMPS